jgi:hypothetical protein
MMVMMTAITPSLNSTSSLLGHAVCTNFDGDCFVASLLAMTMALDSRWVEAATAPTWRLRRKLAGWDGDLLANLLAR